MNVCTCGDRTSRRPAHLHRRDCALYVSNHEFDENVNDASMCTCGLPLDHRAHRT